MYFLYTVLPGASSHTHWTREGVDRALSWAQYCENAVAQFRCRGTLRKALATHVRESHDVASFQDLLKARQMLLKLLLQNQLLEKSVREHILTVAERAHGADFVSHAELAAQQQQQHAKTLLTLLTQPQHSTIDLRLRVRLMLEAANNKEPKEVGLCLAKVAHSPTMLQASLKAALLEEEDAGVRVGPAVVQWVRGVMASPQHQQYRRVVASLCSFEPHHLTRAVANHPQLVMVILKCVHREALSLEPHYDRGGCCWQPRSLSVLSWEDLVRTFGILINHSKMGARVAEAVEDWQLLEGGAVWGDIVRQTKASGMTISPSASDVAKLQGNE